MRSTLLWLFPLKSPRSFWLLLRIPLFLVFFRLHVFVRSAWFCQTVESGWASRQTEACVCLNSYIFWESLPLRRDMKFACTLSTGISVVGRCRKLSGVPSRQVQATASMRFLFCLSILSSPLTLSALKLLLRCLDFVSFMKSCLITLLNVFDSNPRSVNRFWRIFKQFLAFSLKLSMPKL